MTDVNPLKLAFAREHPGDLAAYVATREETLVSEALRGLPEESAAAVVARLPRGYAMRSMARESDEQVAQWLNAADPDQALAVLLHLEDGRRDQLLQKVSSRRKRRALERLLLYPRSTVGALVDPSATVLNADLALGEAIRVLQADRAGARRAVWLVDEADQFVGLLDTGGALLADSKKMHLRRLKLDVRSLRAETSLQDARAFPEWVRFAELPITDHRNRFLGALSHERLMQALKTMNRTDQGLAEGLNDLARQYFRVLGVCLEDLLGGQRKQR